MVLVLPSSRQAPGVDHHGVVATPTDHATRHLGTGPQGTNLLPVARVEDEAAGRGQHLRHGRQGTEPCGFPFGVSQRVPDAEHDVEARGRVMLRQLVPARHERVQGAPVHGGQIVGAADHLRTGVRGRDLEPEPGKSYRQEAGPTRAVQDSPARRRGRRHVAVGSGGATRRCLRVRNEPVVDVGEHVVRARHPSPAFLCERPGGRLAQTGGGCQARSRGQRGRRRPVRSAPGGRAGSRPGLSTAGVRKPARGSVTQLPPRRPNTHVAKPDAPATASNVPTTP